MRAVSIALGALVLCAAGCGSGTPHLSRTDAAPLIALADRIAREGACGQKRDLAAVRAKAIALVNRGAVPSGLEEPLLAGVNDLASRAPACTTPRPAPAPPPPPVSAGQGHSKKHHGHGHDHGHGHGHGKDHGDEGD